MQLARGYIANGEKVKIKASDDLLKNYYKIALLLWKRDKNFIMGSIHADKDGMNYFAVHEQRTYYGHEKVGSYALIEKTNILFFGGELVI